MPGRGAKYVPVEWPYKAGTVPAEAKTNSRRYSRAKCLFVDRHPTPAQIKMLMLAFANEGRIPKKCDRRALKGIVARRFAEVLDDESSQLTPRGLVWCRKHDKAERIRKKKASVARSRAAFAATPESDARAARARAEAFERVMASGVVPPDLAL